MNKTKWLTLRAHQLNIYGMAQIEVEMDNGKVNDLLCDILGTFPDVLREFIRENKENLKENTDETKK